MKTITSLLIGCSLALAGAALAEPPDEQASPGAGQATTEATQPGGKAETGAAKHPRGAGKRAKAEAKSDANASNPEATTAGKPGETKAERRAARQEKKNDAMPNASANTDTNAAGNDSPNESKRGKHGRKGGPANANATASPATSPATGETANPSASAAPSVAASGEQNTVANAKGRRGGKKADPQKVQQAKQNVAQIKQQHASFRAQPKPDKVPAVKFTVNYRIQGSDNWQGPQYEVFRSYHPERHERNWYHSHYTRVELIGGGYYYWNNGYWFPAWGYDPGHEYYAYDAPIYVGHSAEPPDRVIADVQAELQYMGYYTGEVDGLLGPLTRQALLDYQSDQGLMATAVIDQPTLDSLGMG